MIEAFSVDTWIYQTLSGDAELQQLSATAWAALQTPAVTPAPSMRTDNWIWKDLASQGTMAPWLTFAQHSSRDIMGAFGQRIAAEPLYLVRLTAPGAGYAVLQAVANRVDDLLTQPGINATVGTTVVQGVVREQTWELSEVLDNVQFKHVGGLYRFFVSGG